MARNFARTRLSSLVSPVGNVGQQGLLGNSPRVWSTAGLCSRPAAPRGPGSLASHVSRGCPQLRLVGTALAARVCLGSSLVGASRRLTGRGQRRGRKREPVLVGAPEQIVGRAKASDRELWGELEHVYCVNLDRRPERWSFMQQQFGRLGMPVQRWSAVDGQSLDVPHLSEVGLIAKEAMPRFFLPDEQKLFGTDLTLGGIGCALSHMLIWRDVIRRSASSANPAEATFLVLEDDCEFIEGFSEALLRDRLQHVPPDWEIIYLGGQDLLRRQHLYQVGPGVRRLYKGFRETTAYLVNAAGARAALEVCVPMHWQVDTHLNDESLRQGLKPLKGDEPDFTMRPRGYCLFPPVVYQRRAGFPTDVQVVEHN